MSAERTNPSRRLTNARVSLQHISPQDRETFARWLESQTVRLPGLIRQGEIWLRSHPDDQSQAEQNKFWQNYISACTNLAYLVRTQGKGGRSRSPKGE